MTVKSELLELQSAANDGVLHTRAVLKWARAHRASALHKALEWDDAKAGERWRIEQIRGFIEVYVGNVHSEPTLVSLSIDRRNGGGYRRISDVLATPDLREIMLGDALAELERMQRKYEAVAELGEVWAAAARAKVRRGRQAKAA